MKRLFFESWRSIACVAAFIFLSYHAVAQETRVHPVYFNLNSYEPTPEELGSLITFLNSIDKARIAEITVTGYCDDRGGECLQRFPFFLALAHGAQYPFTAEFRLGNYQAARRNGGDGAQRLRHS